MFKKFFFAVVCFSIVAGSACAQESPGIQFIVGPRVGASYTFVANETDYSQALTDKFGGGPYSMLNSVFGASSEQRILLGETRSHFAIQEVFTLGGIEQGIAIPAASVLVGYRSASGFEAGIGPMLSVGGFTVAVAVGYSISWHSVNIPIDISTTIPNSRSPATVMLSTGFNFELPDHR